MTWVNLHSHTEHSFLDGLPSVADLVDRAVELDMPAAAITDHGECSGHLRLQRASLKAGIKPIFGMEGYFTDDRNDRRTKKERKEKGGSLNPRDVGALGGEPYEHITLIAKNATGLRNLWTLSSLGFMEGFYYKPRIDWELLERYHEGLYATSGCLAGCVSAFLNEQGPKYYPEFAVSRAARFLGIFGEDFLFELVTFRDERQTQVNRAVAELAGGFGARMIATCDSHYLRADDWRLHEVMVAAEMKQDADDPGRYSYGPGQLYVLEADDVVARLTDDVGSQLAASAMAMTLIVAEPIDVLIPDGVRSMPVFFDSERTDADVLVANVQAGLGERLGLLGIPWDSELGVEYRMRALDELELIIDKGFSGYFLLVEDIVRWAKGQGILVGPARGSVGGSLVAYALRITEMDPVREGLLFERFLDPGRESLPDIDLDFPDPDVIKEHLREQFQVASIGTLIQARPKLMLRDLGRALKVPLPDVDAMSKIIDRVEDIGTSRVDVGWDTVLERAGADLEPWRERYPDLFEYLGRLQGRLRHSAAHAAGVVLSREPLLGRMPLKVHNGEIRTQMDMGDVEALGFVKIDVLGVRTLATIQEALRLISERHGPDAAAHPYSWQYDWSRYYEDVDVLRSTWEGRQVGVFQLETRGMSELARRYMACSVEELCDVVAVFRPGVTRAQDPATGMPLLEMYLRKREGKLPVEYRHPALEPLLKATYGQFVYQEQVMQAAGELAGYTLTERDRVRKILGKMKSDAMVRERGEFVRRAVERGVEEETAEAVFRDFEKFGIYAFNRSHGMAYATVSYWCAWLKHYFPHEFMAALFATNEPDAPAYRRECRRLLIEVKGPDVHESGVGFAPAPDGSIRYGLHKVKFVGVAAEEVVAKRPFSSLEDAFERIEKRKMTLRVATSLIRVGAFDSLVDPRDCEVLDWPPQVVAAWRYLQWRGTTMKPKDPKWRAFGSSDPDELVQVSEAFDAWCLENTLFDRAECELKLLGGVVTVPPVPERWLPLMLANDDFPGEEALIPGEVKRLAGVIRKVEPRTVRKGKNKGKQMSRAWVERPADPGAEPQEVVVFPDEHEQYGDLIAEGVPVMVRVAKLGATGDGVALRTLLRIDLAEGA